ncbi:MAG: hypothetical protein ACK4TA_08705, partial [Saprospiraceae bacterium]
MSGQASNVPLSEEPTKPEQSTLSEPQVDTNNVDKPSSSDKTLGKVEKNEGSITIVESQTINNIKREVRDDDSKMSSNRFSLQNLKNLSDAELTSVSDKAAVLIKEDKISEIIKKLKEYHLLFLIEGETGGSREVAVQLIGRMSLPGKKYICEILSQNVRIDWIGDFEKLENSAVIFKSATKGDNVDILELINKIERSGNSGVDLPLFQCLKDQKNFFIFILDYEKIKLNAEILKCPFTLKMPPIAMEDLREFFQDSLKRFEFGSLEAPQQNFVEHFPEEWKNEFVNSLHHIDKIDAFVTQLYEAFLYKQKIPSYEELKELSQQTNNISYWLMEVVGKDLQSWNFVLALTLLHSFPGSSISGISLAQFESFRQALSDFQKKQFIQKLREWPGLYPEMDLLKQTRIKKYRDATDSTYQIGFIQEDFAEKIWVILLEDLTINVSQLLPFLFDLTENNPALAPTAASILGRVSVMDSRITRKCLESWSDTLPAESLLHYFLVGVLATTHSNHISFCEKYVDNLLNSKDNNRLWNAIKAYTWMGLYKLPKTMVALKTVVETKLMPIFEQVQKIIRDTSWEIGTLFVGFSISHQMLEKLIEDKVGEKEEVLNYERTRLRICYGILFLCENLDLSSVLAALHQWWQSDKKTVRLIAVQMLLHEDGIFNNLNYTISYRNNMNSDWEDWHKIILDLSVGDAALDSFITFLKEVVETFPDFRASQGRYYERQLIGYLEDWITASLDNDNATKVVLDLYGRMLEIKELNAPMEQQLREWTDIHSTNLRLKTFA